MNPGVVILAAGESARMGTPKQLLAYRGETLLQRTIGTALSLRGARVVVVLGAHAELIRQQLGDPGVTLVENPNWRDGMGSSLRAGLGGLVAAQPEVPGAIFLVCDQPLVTPATLADLVAAHESSGRAIVASDYAGTLGTPALFGRDLFSELLASDSRDGARNFIRARRDQAIGVDFHGGAVDIDTPAEYDALRAPASNSPPPPPRQYET